MNTYHRSEQQIKHEQLEIKAAQRNPQRFNVLYERYYEQIFLFIFKRVGTEEEAADVCSQVFLKVMLNLSKYQFRGLPFSSWLYRIASNEVMQFFRTNKKERQVSMESAGITLFMEEVESADNEESINKMTQAFEHLKAEELHLLELRYFEKMPFRQVAEILNITENNAKVRMFRVLKKMKKLMTK